MAAATEAAATQARLDEAPPHHWSWETPQEAAAEAAAQAHAQGGAAAREAKGGARFGRSTASFNSALIACVECGQLEQASSPEPEPEPVTRARTRTRNPKPNP